MTAKRQILKRCFIGATCWIAIGAAVGFWPRYTLIVETNYGPTLLTASYIDRWHDTLALIEHAIVTTICTLPVAIGMWAFVRWKSSRVKRQKS